MLLALGLARPAQAAPAASAPTPTADLTSLQAQIEQAAPSSADWPTAPIATLHDASLDANASMGFAAAISGDIAVVGAYRADSGVITDTGKVSVYYRNYGAGGRDNWGLVKELTSPDAASGDMFGFTVAVSGDTVVVGAYLTDVGGNINQGAAYVYRRNNDGLNAWGLAKKLVAADGAAYTSFGISVGVSGDTIVVGADAAVLGGKAYVFARNQGGADTWGQVKKLAAADSAGGDYFGTAVAISGDIIVVGAYWADINGVSNQGAAYVFYRNNGGADAWGLQRKVVAADGVADSDFGIDVAISGDTLVVGAWYATVGANPDQGAAYVFTRNQGGASNWGQVKKLVASDGANDDRYGQSVDVSDDMVIVGARWADIGGALRQGKAYLYERNQGGADQWGQLNILIAPDGVAGDRFGVGAAISGNFFIVGAPGHQTSGAAYVYSRSVTAWSRVARPSAGAAGDRFGYAIALDTDTLVVGADGADGSGTDSGAAYVFERNTGGGEAWGLVKTLTAPAGAAGDHFGQAVAIADDTIVVGAPGKSGGAGAAYIFERNHPATAEGWGLRATLLGAAGDQLGYALAISGDRVAAGAPGAASGAALVYERNQGGQNAWGQVRRLAGSAAGDQFGAAVALDGDTLLVGAPNADPAGLADAGGAAVYERNQGGAEAWGLVKDLAPAGRLAGDHFGRAVALADDTALVGAPDADPSGRVDAGAAYVFFRNMGGAYAWGQRAALSDAQSAAGDRFGFALDLYQDTAVVGAPRAASGSVLNQGAALVFERNVGGIDTWGRVARLMVADGAAEDRLGFAVALGNEFMAAGALRADVGGAVDQGAAYVFRAWTNASSLTYVPMIQR
jgi:hypothetical protein